MLQFFDSDVVDVQHELTLYAVHVCAHAFGVFYHGVAVAVGIDEVGDVAAWALDEFAVAVALCGYEFVAHLFAQVADSSGPQQQPQLVGPAVFLSGGISAGLLSVVFIAAPRLQLFEG